MADIETAVRGGDPRNGQRSGEGSSRRRRPARGGPPGRRRAAVPGGRAVLGGLLVAASVVGLFYASTRTETGPKESYVVAAHALAPGARLTAADLTRTPLDLPAALADRAFTDPTALEGATLIAPLAAGELIQASAVVAKPSSAASREVTFAVPRATLTSSLERGERIDVVATYGSGADAFSTVVLRQALVVELDRGRDRVGDQGDAAVTVAVDDVGDAVALAHAVQLAKLTVVRSTGAASGGTSGSVFRQPAPGPAPTTAGAARP
jgi:hypothetical protein